MALITQANQIIAEYQEQGYLLTLRQLYYQFVSRDIISNAVAEYKRLGSVVNDARLAGLIDWEAIEDRTRNLAQLSTWDHPSGIISAAAEQFRLDLWSDQFRYIEVWIEKEALAGVFQRVCDQNRVSFFSCRGYVSQSEMWSAAQRFSRIIEDGREPTILHFGDHDPSGIDMSRDIEDRINLFLEDKRGNFTIERLALNMDQIRKYQPPPNPAKENDSRFRDYKKNYGDQSWELDALEPAMLSALVQKAVDGYRDKNKWSEKVSEENLHRKNIAKVAKGFK